MSYQVIARKYRPQRFSQVVGQEHVTRTLCHAIEQNRIAHAYLFCGPRGTGKTTIARIFAKCLNCKDGPKVEFDENDPNCREIAEGRSLDVLEIDGASNRGIDEVRELRETVKYAPVNSRFKVYIIDEVHMLTREAFNALLKTLEEPPPHVKFMFATTEPDKIPPTILSRCQRFDLRRIPSALIAKHLKWICQQENVEADDAALYAIARGADGAMRDAQSALDQLISFCGNQIREEHVLTMFGLASQTQIIEIARAILAGDRFAILQNVDQLASRGKDLGRLLSELLSMIRNLLVYKVAGGAPTMLDVSETEAAALAELAPQVDVPTLTNILDILVQGESAMRDTASRRVLLEVVLLKATQTKDALHIDALLDHLRQLRDPGHPAHIATLPQPAPAQTAHAPTPGPTTNRTQPAPARTGSAPSNTESVPAPGPATDTPGTGRALADPQPTDADLKSVWNRVMEELGRISPFTRLHLEPAFPLGLEGGTLRIGFDAARDDLFALVDNRRTYELLETQFKRAGVRFRKIEFVRTTPPAPTQQTSATSEPAVAAPAKLESAVQFPISLEDFKNDPLIREALDLFRGQLVQPKPETD